MQHHHCRSENEAKAVCIGRPIFVHSTTMEQRPNSKPKMYGDIQIGTSVPLSRLSIISQVQDMQAMVGCFGRAVSQSYLLPS